jgi:carbon storage regulator CsrA
MLALTRNVGQVLYIGPDITVTIHKVSGQQVRLAIDASDNLLILRKELVEDIHSPSEPPD